MLRISVITRKHDNQRTTDESRPLMAYGGGITVVFMRRDRLGIKAVFFEDKTVSLLKFIFDQEQDGSSGHGSVSGFR
jgi:hypothetical protein